MSHQAPWETIKVQGGHVVEELKRLLHEGNVRRVRVKQGDRTVAEFPLTVGLVGAVAAPVLAAIGALAALLAECTIDVERTLETPTDPGKKARRAPSKAKR